MAKKERELTAKEKIRKEEFDEFCIQMEKKGYSRHTPYRSVCRNICVDLSDGKSG